MKRVVAYVVVVHLLLLISLSTELKEEKKPPFKPLQVHQYTKKQIALTPAPPFHPLPPPPPTRLKKPQKPPASPPPKAKAKPSPLPSSPPVVKRQTKTTSPVTEKLLQEIEESIAKIEGKHDKVDTNKQIKTPRTIDALQRDQPPELEPEQSNYSETLILCLRGALHLPDFGEVKIKLTLRQDGSVETLSVLKTESENNKRYLETHLPHVKFPALNKQEHTFVLTFCNEV